MLPQRATRCVVAAFGDVLRVRPFDGDAGVVSLAYGVLTIVGRNCETLWAAAVPWITIGGRRFDGM